MSFCDIHNTYVIQGLQQAHFFREHATLEDCYEAEEKTEKE